MNGSGLDKAFEEVNSEGTIKHIFSGHAAVRALRADILVQSALVNYISSTIDVYINAIIEEILTYLVLNFLCRIAIKNGLTKQQIADVSNSDAFVNIVNVISNYSKEKSKESRTANLWLLYIEYT